MAGSTTSSSIAAAKNAGADQNAIDATTDGLSASEKRRLAALKGWERKREQEKNAGSPKKTRITPSRSARSVTKPAVAPPKQPNSKSKVVKKSVASAQKKGWETRKKKAAAAAAAAVASPTTAASSSTTKTKSLTHSEAAKLGWERIRKKKALEEAKAKAAAAASKKKSSTKAKGLSRAEAAKLGWERMRAKKMQEEDAAAADSTAAVDAGDEDEDAELFKARSKSSKKGWETRKKKALGEVKVEVKVKDKLFAVRSKSSKKGWETRRKLAGIAAKQEVEDTDEWQQRSNASKKGWETRRKLAADASAKKQSVTHSEAWGDAAKLGSERKRKMEDMSDESPEYDETSRKKPYTAAARSKAAKMAWQKAKEKNMLMTSTATASSGRAYYQQDSAIAAHTYTAERVEWEIRQKMLAAANADEDSSSEDESDVESSELEDSSDGGVEEKREEIPVEDISRNEAANLLLAMFGNSAPAAPAAKVEDTSGTDTSQETSIAEALKELKGAKSEDTSFSVDIYGDGVNKSVMDDTSVRGHMMHDDEYTSSAKAPNVKSSSSKARASSAKSIPKSRTRSGGSKAASKPAAVATKGKTSKQRSTTARQGWQKRKSEVFKKSKLDPQENEQIAAAIAAVNKSVQLAAGKEMVLPRGVTVRPSGKWVSAVCFVYLPFFCSKHLMKFITMQSFVFASQQAQLYYAGKSRYIGVFESREDACYAYEVARQILLSCKEPKDDEVETNINLARKAAFAGVH